MQNGARGGHLVSGWAVTLLDTAVGGWAVRRSSSSSVLLYVHRDHKDYQGREAQDGHLEFHTAPEV